MQGPEFQFWNDFDEIPFVFSHLNLIERRHILNLLYVYVGYVANNF